MARSVQVNLKLAGPCIFVQFKKIKQPEATVSQIYYLTFMFRSTCFGRLHAHHQELTTALTASGFTLKRGGSSVVGRGLAGYDRQNHDQQNKRQVIDLSDGCIWLVNVFVQFKLTHSYPS
jgi:hypothetical protein